MYIIITFIRHDNVEAREMCNGCNGGRTETENNNNNIIINIIPREFKNVNEKEEGSIGAVM